MLKYKTRQDSLGNGFVIQKELNINLGAQQARIYQVPSVHKAGCFNNIDYTTWQDETVAYKKKRY